MSGYVSNILNETLSNENFRKVLFTSKHSQLVVMHLQPSEDIGMEVHNNVDQFIRIEKGVGKAILDGAETEIADDFAIVIPAGTMHNVVNTSMTEPMKLYTIYSPANHPDGTIHATKAEAEADEKDHEFQG
jgi:mannose-6-phosphate isomerase-like protein (cupin superfamily)